MDYGQTPSVEAAVDAKARHLDRQGVHGRSKSENLNTASSGAKITSVFPQALSMTLKRIIEDGARVHRLADELTGARAETGDLAADQAPTSSGGCLGNLESLARDVDRAINSLEQGIVRLERVI